MPARTTSPWTLSAYMRAATKTVKRFCSASDAPGEKMLAPVSVLTPQLLCLPEPLSPLNGFSWKSTSRSWRCAASARMSIARRFWSAAELVIEKIGAVSCCAGATSLWRVAHEIPDAHISAWASRSMSRTRSGIRAK
eukprot:Amastigsp_a845891_8.p5 type:complete len:137 gc:universal Amastigsp_a845891_8:996-1406(+)